MLTIIFVCLLLSVVFKLFFFGLKAAWSITKLLVSLLLLPAVVIVLFVIGLTYVAIPVLVVVGLVTILKKA